ncbi:MAG: RNA 2',3'-cyclic phosphodiesterase [Oscillospiraceae bacterium]|jgi:2'-5' RNA ligase
MRLFIAVQFSAEIHEKLLAAIDELRAQSLSGNFTRPENLHMTLAFIGESNETAVIRRVLDALPAGAFPITVGGSGHFGDLYWVGVEKNKTLQKLVRALRDGLREAGIAFDEKPFRPHITIGRQIVSDMPVALTFPETEMTVDRVSLMKSERVNGRLVYTEIYGRKL